MDHAGGVRTYVAEGATIIVPSQSAEYLEKAIRTSHTIVPDAQEKNPRPVNVYGVFENMTIKDETGELRLYNTAAGAETAARLPNAHVDGMLIGHVVDKKIVYVTDLISPRGAAIPRAPETIAVGNTLREFDVNDADIVFAGGHGGTIKRAEIAAAIAPN
jgi:hypothetical protein